MFRPSPSKSASRGFFLLGASIFLAIALLVTSAALGHALAESATITFRKIFKSSYPEFVEIKVNENGSATYDIRQLDEPSSPAAFQVGGGLVQKIFGLAAKLHNFQGVDLEVHRRIANLGEKTLQYEKGGDRHEVKFNYTLDESATQLLNIFEGLSRQENDLSTLMRVMRYDRLGVNDAVGQLETDFNNKLLPEPERLLPALDQVAADDTYLDIARQRAHILASKIRGSR
ncbi:MAG TPA: hypothetical protein VEU52_00600 [Candidatus Limnocylindrales bacterium]|jgi:hypothetical protein|nr:hypothetical protein [Candidatus Limnocylindrales bacterium]